MEKEKTELAPTTEKPTLNFERKIKLDYSPIHNRGVFATEDIKKDEIIEICPMIILGFRMNYHHDPAIRDYCFTHTCPCDECKRHGGHFLMVLGYGQIYNHHDDNNARISFNLKESLAFIQANREIRKDEEIFVSYGDAYFKNRVRKQAESTKKEQTVNQETTPQGLEPMQLPQETPFPSSSSFTGNVFNPI